MGTEEDILKTCHTIAIVGLSNNPERPSHHVGQYLKDQGYCIYPVNPAEKNILGEVCYPDLASIPGPIDAVDIFRKPEDVPAIVKEAIARGAKAVWMQEGVVNEAAAEAARQAGLKVVMNKCMLKEHFRLLGEKS